MDYDKKIRLIERCLFVVLLIGLGVAGAIYETYKETVRSELLLPFLAAFKALCYVTYRGSLWLVVRFMTLCD